MPRAKPKPPNNVAYLPGCEPTKGRKKSSKVVRNLRRLLTMAEAGKLTGFAYVGVSHEALYAGVSQITDHAEALRTVEQLRGAVLGDRTWILPTDD